MRRPIDNETLRRELQELARAQNKQRFQQVEAPALDSIVKGSSLDHRLAAIDAAIEQIDDPTTRQIATILFSTEADRWGLALGQRRKVAGESAGFNPESFRRKGVDGLSDYDRITDAVCHELLSFSRPKSPTEHEPSTEHEPTTELTEPNRLPIGPRRVVLGVAALALAIAAAIIIISSGNTDRDPVAVEGCDIPVGAAMNPAGIVGPTIDALIAEYQDQGGRSAVGCPATTTEQWEGLWIQPLTGTDTTPAGSIVHAEDMLRALWIEQGMLRAYQHSAGGELPQLAGWPTSVTISNGHNILGLSNGGVVVSHGAPGPAYWIPAEAITAWGGLAGELGLPMTDVNYIDGELTQHYEYGVLRQGANDTVRADLVTATDVEAEMAELADPPGIVRSYDSTAWWIDANGTRSWIPDADTWHCLGGDNAVLDDELAGWAIAARFEWSGESASCR